MKGRWVEGRVLSHWSSGKGNVITIKRLTHHGPINHKFHEDIMGFSWGVSPILKIVLFLITGTKLLFGIYPDLFLKRSF